MKKLLLLLLITLLASNVFGQRPTGVIRQASVPPVINGELDAVWDEANVYDIDKPFRMEVPTLGQLGETNWRALWDADGMYIFIEVNDDHWYPSYIGGGDGWMFDKPEVYFDVNYILEDGGGAGTLNNGHHQVSPSPIDVFIDGTATTEDNGVIWAFKVTNPTYTVEYFVPWSLLVDENNVQFNKTAPMGFDVTIIDRDPGYDRSRMVWANIGEKDESWSNMDDVGYITFEGAVENVLIDEIVLNGGSITRDNGTLQIKTVLTPADATFKNLRWSIENKTGRASISQTGLVTAIADGVVTVRAEAMDGSNKFAELDVTISGQITTMWELNVIRNGLFEQVNENGSATHWGGWGGDANTPLPTVQNGVAVATPILANEVWQYQFTQNHLTARPDIEYIFEFVAWADAPRTFTVNFEDIGNNGHNRYGSTQDPRSANGRSEWTFDITTEPTRYTFDVVFDEILPSTDQKVNFMLGHSGEVTNIDSILLIAVEDLSRVNRKPHGVINKASVAPVINGEMDVVWDEANIYKIDKPFGDDIPTIGQPGETTWRALWDADGMYIFIEVNDDAWYPSYIGGGDGWMFDKPELYFDVNKVLEDDLGAQHLNGHHQVTPTPVEALIDGTATTEGNGIIWAYKVANPAYTVEYFIPWTHLTDKDGLSFDKTGTMGFDVTIIDRDPGDEDRRRMVWANTGEKDESWSNMDDAGYITFEGVEARIMVESIVLTGGNISEDNGTLQIQAKIFPADATIKNLRWSIENKTGRATISQTGLVTAIADGIVTVSAETTDDSYVIFNDVDVEISGQYTTIWDLNVIKNGLFEQVNENGTATHWDGWSGDANSPLPTIQNGVAVATPFLAEQVWQYQLYQSKLTALPDIDYLFEFVAWSDVARTITVSFEDIGNNHNHPYGSTNDLRSTNGRSEWTFNINTEPTRYTFDVVFDEILLNTDQRVNFLLAHAAGVTYIDSVLLIEVDPPYNLTLASNPIDGGIVTGEGQHMQGSRFPISATPNTGYSFSNWTLNNGMVISDLAAYLFEMTAADITLTANFILTDYTISAIVAPANAGIINGAGIYNMGDKVSLEAVAATGYEFVNWTNMDDVEVSNQANYNFTMPADDISLKANFILIDYTVSATIAPADAGIINGAGIYNMGEAVSLEAVAATGYEFVNWTNADLVEVSNQATYNFSMPANNVSLTANFKLSNFAVTLVSNPITGGTLFGAGTYRMGDQVMVGAIPSTDYVFKGWLDMDDKIVSTKASYTFTMPASAVALKAHFIIPTYNVSLSVMPEGAGNSFGAGSYKVGEQVALGAVANPGHVFLNWINNSEQQVTDNPIYNFSMPAQDVSFIAQFDVIDYIGELQDGQVKIYPNPTIDSFNIQSDQLIKMLEIIDFSGRIILQQSIHDNESRISTHNFDAGIYIVRIFTQQGIHTEKVMIKK